MFRQQQEAVGLGKPGRTSLEHFAGPFRVALDIQAHRTVAAQCGNTGSVALQSRPKIAFGRIGVPTHGVGDVAEA